MEDITEGFMFTSTKSVNTTAFLLLLLGFILHFSLPGRFTMWSDLPLLLAVLFHGAYLLGKWQIVVYVLVAMVIGYFAEFIGINTFLVFGAYHYNPATSTNMLFGVSLFVPVMYPVLTYAINLFCVALSAALLTKRNCWLLALLTGTFAMTKDLVTDPLQSTVAQFWIWNNGGVYFGVPIHNFIGWFCVYGVITLVAVALTWNNTLAEKIKTDKQLLAFPIALFFITVLYGVISAITVPETFRGLGNVSLLIAIFVLIPCILLAWFNVFKREA